MKRSRTRELLAMTLALPFVVFATTAVAQQGPVVELTGVLSNPAPVTGETVRLDVKLINRGPSGIRNTWTGIDWDGGLVTAVRCGTGHGSPPFQIDASCWLDALGEGEEANYSIDILVGNSTSTLSIRGFLGYTSGVASRLGDDPHSFSITAPVSRAARTVDLAVAAHEEPALIPLGNTTITYETTIRNLGPDSATDVLLLIDDPQDSRLDGDSFEGAVCDEVQARVICRVGSIVSGSEAKVRYQRTGYTDPQQKTRTVSVFASQSFDPAAANSSLTRQVIIGLPAELTRVLLPIVIYPTDGANGSRWISEVSIFVDSEAELFVFPTVFDCPVLCPEPQLYGSWVPSRRTWRPHLPGWSTPGSLLRFDKSRAQEISISARIRDVSRASETLGTAVPVVTDDDLRRGCLQLIDIPTGPDFRQRLRVYEPDATDASVRVRLFGERGDETLLADETLVLATRENNQRPDANVGLPYDPGYGELDLSSRFPTLNDYDRLRVEISGLSDSTSYWAFASVTNNWTQEVTLVLPGRGR